MLPTCDCSMDVMCRPTVMVEHIRTAKKEHQCCECDNMIKPGAKYQDVTGIWDGHPNRYRTCLPCVGIRRDYFDDFNFGELREAFYECFGFSYNEVPEEEEEEDDASDGK